MLFTCQKDELSLTKIQLPEFFVCVSFSSGNARYKQYGDGALPALNIKELKAIPQTDHNCKVWEWKVLLILQKALLGQCLHWL